MSDTVDLGFTVTEMAAMGQPIDMSRETTAAFVGRTLRGPLNHPILIHNVGEFRRHFGDVWSRSSLGPAVQQFFDHGGNDLYIVRVANNARGAMICLPASGSALVLRTLQPGSTERIRAAVDFDGIDDDNKELFNLTLQRLDSSGNLVVDQELFRRISHREEADQFIADVLLSSSLVRAETPYPTHRPEATFGAHLPLDSGYVQHAQEGTDGHELSDYDLIGSRDEEVGLFALQQIKQFDLLYLPPPGKGRDPGPASILAAERYCRERGAMLIVDPSNDWTTPDDAIRGIRDRGYASPNMVSYFPRMRHRNDTDEPARAVGGALAGLFCKSDRRYGAWQALDQHGIRLNRTLIPASRVGDVDVRSLARHGLNAITGGPAGSARMQGSVTMGRGSESHRKFASLPVRRLCLRILTSIDQATRWTVFAVGDARLAQRIRGQVSAYMQGLADMGALENDRFTVACESGPGQRNGSPQQGVTILLEFRPRSCATPVALTLHQTAAGCRLASTAFAPA